MNCFHILILKKIRDSRQKSNFTCIKVREFAFVGPFALLYCHKFGQHLGKSQQFVHICIVFIKQCH